MRMDLLGVLAIVLLLSRQMDLDISWADKARSGFECCHQGTVDKVIIVCANFNVLLCACNSHCAKEAKSILYSRVLQRQSNYARYSQVWPALHPLIQ